MCGIAGFWLTERGSGDPEHALLEMTYAIRHRGPDDEGVWFDPETGVGLGHRRLSIIDLSPRGRQPMWSSSGRFGVVFNGEFYSFREERASLAAQGVEFVSHSDTEVFLAAVERYGVAAALTRMSGMFAIALYDRRERELHLVRDRLGEKPLYFGTVNGALVFGSELKALRAFPGWSGEINRDALTLFMRHNCIPAPYSIYRNVGKVEPGTILSFRADGGAWSPRRTTYWSARQVADEGHANPFVGDASAAIDQLDVLLRRVISNQMEADVPLGAFLSGGIDSSLVVALMQTQRSVPVQTFTIGFEESDYDESADAARVAAHLGTAHEVMRVTAGDTLAVVPELPAIFDEPFGDASQIPTLLVARLARRAVTVSLSGDGGDELFGGYWRHFFGPRLWRRIAPLPRWLRAAVARGILRVPPATWSRWFGAVEPVLPSSARLRMPGDRLHKLAGVLDAESTTSLYRALVSHWTEPASVVIDGAEPPTALTDAGRLPGFDDAAAIMMFLDAISYLPDDILVKVDRATMAVALESRAPFLDHRVYEFAWRLPPDLKIRGGKGKWILRQLLSRYLPEELVDRPKMGFGVPIEHWLRGPLREWAGDLLSDSRLRRQGLFRPGPIRERWDEHQSGRRNWQYLLWDVLTVQAWLEAQPAAEPVACS